MSPALAIHVEPPGPFKPGEWVRGRVDVLEGGNSRALHVEVRFRERTSDYSATPANYGRAELHQGELVAGANFPFAIQLPADCFPSFATSNAALYYELHAKSDEPGLDTHSEEPIVVTTGG